MRLRLGHLLFAGSRKREEAFSFIFSTPDANPPVLLQQRQSASKGRAIHDEAGAESFLVGFPHESQCAEQAELGDFKAGLSQFLVINASDDTRGAPQVLTGARQLKKGLGRRMRRDICLHITCSYIYERLLSNDGEVPGIADFT